MFAPGDLGWLYCYTAARLYSCAWRQNMIILIGSEKGGVGKSTIATSIAVLLAEQGRDVLLVDADRQGSAADWCSLRTEEGVDPRIPCMQRYGATLHREVMDLADRYQDLVIDSGGRDSKELRSGMVAADVLLIPVQPGQFDSWAAERMVEVVEAARIPNPELTVRVTVNRAPTHWKSAEAEDARNFLAGELGFTVANAVLHERVAFRRASNQGKVVTELQPPDPKAGAELTALFEEVMSLCPT